MPSIKKWCLHYITYWPQVDLFPQALLFVEDLKTEKILFVNRLSYFGLFACLLILPWVHVQHKISHFQIMLIILVQLFRVVEFALKVVLLFHSQYICAHKAFRQQFKDGEILFVNTLSSIIKGKLYIKFVTSTPWSKQALFALQFNTNLKGKNQTDNQNQNIPKIFL